MPTTESSPSLGLTLGLPIGLLITLIALVFTVACAIYWIRNRDTYGSDAAWGVALGVAVLLVALVVTGFTMWPWKYEYHSWTKETGTIAAISDRLMPSGDSIQQKFVVRFTDGRERGCEDTRCALLKPGDTLILSCKRAWQFSGTDGWDCAYVSSEPVAS